MYHIKRGETRTQAAINVGAARGSVNTWVKNYSQFGLEGLKDKPKAGRPNKLTTKQNAVLKQFILDNAIKQEGGRLIGEDVRDFIRDTFAIDYQLRNVYRIMHSLGLSWITSRSKHPKQSQAVQDAFKKFPTGNDPSHTGSSIT